MNRTVCSDGGSFDNFYLIRSCVNYKYDCFLGRKYYLLRLEMENSLKSRENDLPSCVQKEKISYGFWSSRIRNLPESAKILVI